MKAWLFTPQHCRLSYGDNRLVEVGSELTFQRDAYATPHGFTGPASMRDTLDCARGAFIWRVELGGHIDAMWGRLRATQCMPLWGFNMRVELHSLACECAREVQHLWSMPNSARRYLTRIYGDCLKARARRDCSASAITPPSTWSAASACRAVLESKTSWYAARCATYLSERAIADAATRVDHSSKYDTNAWNEIFLAARVKHSRRLDAMIMARAKTLGFIGCEGEL